MGFTQCCFNPDNKQLIAKSDLNFIDGQGYFSEIENKELHNCALYSSNNKSTTSISPITEPRNIFINPLPDIVKIKRKKIK